MKRVQKINPDPLTFNDPIRNRITRRVHDATTAKMIILEYNRNNQTTNDYDLLADAYAYFMAEPENDTDKMARNRFKWMASATAHSQDSRYYLRYVLARGKDLVASNGIRFQKIGDTRQPGYYMPDRKKILCQYSQMRYPPIDDQIGVPDQQTRIRDAKKRNAPGNELVNPSIEIVIPGSEKTSSIIVEKQEYQKAIAAFGPDDWIDIQMGASNQNLYQASSLVIASANDETHPRYATLYGVLVDR